LKSRVDPSLIPHHNAHPIPRPTTDSPPPNYDDNRISTGLIGLLGEQVQQLIRVHVYQRFHVDSQLGGQAWYTHTKRLQQLDEVHFFACTQNTNATVWNQIVIKICERMLIRWKRRSFSHIDIITQISIDVIRVKTTYYYLI